MQAQPDPRAVRPMRGVCPTGCLSCVLCVLGVRRAPACTVLCVPQAVCPACHASLAHAVHLRAGCHACCASWVTCVLGMWVPCARCPAYRASHARASCEPCVLCACVSRAVFSASLASRACVIHLRAAHLSCCASLRVRPACCAFCAHASPGPFTSLRCAPCAERPVRLPYTCVLCVLPVLCVHQVHTPPLNPGSVSASLLPVCVSHYQVCPPPGLSGFPPGLCHSPHPPICSSPRTRSGGGGQSSRAVA